MSDVVKALRSVAYYVGYDCRKECSHERKGEHGIAAEEWALVVTHPDREVAVCLGVAGRYPASVTHTQDAVGAMYLTEHVGFPHGKWPQAALDDIQSSYKLECAFVRGHCRGAVSTLRARELVQTHLSADLDALSASGRTEVTDWPEALWEALEAHLAETYEQATRMRLDTDPRWDQLLALLQEG